MADEGRTKKVFLGLVVFALVGFAGYRWWATSPEVIIPTPPVLSDYRVTWECIGCRNRMEAPAAAGAQACDKCGKVDAYVVMKWMCPQHGVRETFIRYRADGQVSDYRTREADWKPAAGPEGGWNVKCQTCGALMSPLGAGRLEP